MADFEPRPHAPRAGAPAIPALRRRRCRRTPSPDARARRVPRSEIEDWEGRLEFWDAATEIAWVAAPTTPYHEKPSRRLAALMDRIAAERGSGHRVLRVDGPDAARPSTAPRGASCRPTSPCTCIPGARGCTGPKAMMAGERRLRRTWCWRSITRRTCGGPSWGCTKHGASPRCGWRCRSRGRRAGRAGAGRG